MCVTRTAKIKRVAAPLLIVLLTVGFGVGAALNLRHTASSAKQRGELVNRAEAAISGDARRLVAEGKLRGPVLRTRCEPFTDDPKAAKVRRYRCIAVRTESARNYTGQVYIARLDFERDSFTYKRTKIPLYLGI